MDKIKNILSGNKNDVATSDNTAGTTSGLHSGTTTGQTSGLTSGTTTGNQTGLSGEGSHFGNTRDTVGSGNTSGLTGQNTSGLGNAQNTTGLGSAPYTQGTTTAGPYTSNLANKVDPRVDSDLDGSRTVGNTGGVGNTSAGTSYGTSTGTGNTTTQYGNTGFSGPHKTEAANRLDPSVNPSGGTGLETSHHHSTTHGGGAEEADTHHGSHLGRDAVVGAGGVGLAEHEHNKHKNERGTGIEGTTGTSTGAYDNTTGTLTTGTGHQSHLGRDAGIGAAGVSAAGLAEHEHNKHSATTASSLPGPAPNTAGPHRKDWLNKLDPRVNANPDQHQSTGHGPLKVEESKIGAAKPYDPTTGYISNPHHHGVTDVNPDGSTTRTANLTHHSRSRANDLPGHDAAAVAALGGAGAYEAGKHHHGTESGIGGTSSTTAADPHSSNLANKILPTAPGNHGVGTGAGTQNALAGDNTTVGAGGVGLAEHEHRKHEGFAGSGYDNTSSGLTGSNQGHSSHLGRDAAGLGAAGLVGDHEYKKHQAKNEGVANGRQYDNTTSTSPGLTGSHQGSEYRKDDMTTGQYINTGQQSSLGGQESIPRSEYDSKTTGGISGIGGAGGDRNRLHRDPPTDLPVAQGGVPGSETEREDDWSG